MKIVFRIVALCVCFSMVLSGLTVGAAAKNNSNTVTTGKAETVSVVEYDEYTNKFGFASSTQDISAKLSSTDGDVSEFDGKNSVLLKAENYAVFTVDVSKDAAYNIEMVFADVKESVEEYHFSLSI